MPTPTATNPQTGETFELIDGEWRTTNNVPNAATEQTSNLEAFGIGVARNATRKARGAQNLAFGALEQAGQDIGPARENLTEQQREEDLLFKNIETNKPNLTAAGDITAELSTLPLGATQRAIGGLQRASRGIQQSLIGATQGGLNFEESIGDQGIGALTGGAFSVAGEGVGGFLSKLGRRASGQLPDSVGGIGGAEGEEAFRLLQRADDLGFRLTPGERTGNESVRMLEESARRNVFFGPLLRSSRKHNADRLNQVTLNALGESGTDVSEAVLGRAKTRIGNVFNNRLDNLGDDIQPSFEQLEDLAVIRNDIANLNVDGAGQAVKSIDRLLNTMVDGKLSGKALQNFRTEFSEKAFRNFSKGKSAAGQAFSNADDVLLDLIGDDPVMQTARNQYQVLKALSKGKAVTGGNVNPTTLKNNLDARSKSIKFGRTQSDLADSLRIAERNQSLFGDSGTAQALSIDQFLNHPVASTVGLGVNALPGVGRALERGVLEAGTTVRLPADPLAEASGAAIGRAGAQQLLLEDSTQ